MPDKKPNIDLREAAQAQRPDAKQLAERVDLEKVIEGKTGNGAYVPITQEINKQRAELTRAHNKELQLTREEALNEGYLEALKDGKAVRTDILLMAREINKKPLYTDEGDFNRTKEEITILKLANDVAEKIENRTMGKATTRIDAQVTHEHSFAKIWADMDDDVIDAEVIDID